MGRKPPGKSHARKSFECVWPMKLLCKLVTNPLKPTTNACAHPINLCNSLGSGLSDPAPVRWMQQEPWLESAINFPFFELHCLGGLLSSCSGIQTLGITVPSLCSISLPFHFLKNYCVWGLVFPTFKESWILSLKKVEFFLPFGFCPPKPVHPKGDQSWVFIGRTDPEAETPILWPPHVKSWLIGKDPDAGRDWRQEEKGTTEDEMAGWHLWLDGHEFE